MEDLDLPIPRMVIDDNYVGEPPKVEVTMDNLNDNIEIYLLRATSWDYFSADASRKCLAS